MMLSRLSKEDRGRYLKDLTIEQRANARGLMLGQMNLRERAVYFQDLGEESREERDEAEVKFFDQLSREEKDEYLHTLDPKERCNLEGATMASIDDPITRQLYLSSIPLDLRQGAHVAMLGKLPLDARVSYLTNKVSTEDREAFFNSLSKTEAVRIEGRMLLLMRDDVRQKYMASFPRELHVSKDAMMLIAMSNMSRKDYLRA